MTLSFPNAGWAAAFFMALLAAVPCAPAATALAETAAGWQISNVEATFDGIEGLLLESAAGGSLRRDLPSVEPGMSLRIDAREARGLLDVILVETGGRSHRLARIRRPEIAIVPLPEAIASAKEAALILRVEKASRLRLMEVSLVSDGAENVVVPSDVAAGAAGLPGPLAALLKWQWDESGKGVVPPEFLSWARSLAGLTSHGQWRVFAADRVVAVFLERDGNVSLENVVGLQSGIPMQQCYAGAIAPNLWDLELADGRRLRPRKDWRVDFQPEDDGLLISWIAPREGDVTGVEIRVQADGEGGILIRSGATSARAGSLHKLEAPIVGGLSLPDQSAELFVPRGHGLVEKTPLANAVRFAFTYPSPFMMQYGAYSDGASGLYWEIRDPDGIIKDIRTVPAAEAYQFAVGNYVPMDATSSEYGTPYPVRLKPFGGDWFDASVIYRGWARRQPWCARGPMPDGKTSRLLGMDGWLWLTKWLDKPERLAKHLEIFAGCRMAVLNHDWRADEFDVNYPVYEPANPASLKHYVQMVHAHDGIWIPYFNVRAWQRETKSWQAAGAGNHEIIGRDGQPDHDTFLGNPQSVMDPSSAFWQKTVVEFVERIITGFDMDGAYLDQLGASYPKINYDRNAESFGDPRAWTRGQIRMAESVLEKLKSFREDFISLTETCGELFIPYRDAALLFYIKHLHDHAKWVPAYQAVYHPYDLTVGQPVLPRQPQFRYLAARDLAMGNQPFLNIHEDPARNPGEIAFFGKLLEFYRGHREFLAWGEMLHPPRVSAETVDVDWEWRDRRGVAKAVSSVEASAWQAPDGRILLLAINHTSRSAAAEIVFRPNRGAGKPVKIPDLRAAGASPFTIEKSGGADGEMTLRVKLDPESLSHIILQAPQTL